MIRHLDGKGFLSPPRSDRRGRVNGLFPSGTRDEHVLFCAAPSLVGPGGSLAQKTDPRTTALPSLNIRVSGHRFWIITINQ